MNISLVTALSITLLLISSHVLAGAGPLYVYVENPDKEKLYVTWSGQEPNCYEQKSANSETFGWRIDPRINFKVGAEIRLKNIDYVEVKPLCTFFFGIKYLQKKLWFDDYCNVKTGEAGNTFWITTKPYTPYETWACG